MNRNHFLIPALVLAVSILVLSSVVMVQRTNAAARAVTGRGIIRDGGTTTSAPIDVLQTTPQDNQVVGARGKLILSSATRIIKNTGTTPIGASPQPVKTTRVTAGNLLPGNEVSFQGTYTPGDKNSLRPTTVTIHDRSFTVCGPLQGIVRRTATNANDDTATLNITKATVQEARFARFFPAGKDVLFFYGDSTKFHNANGSWKAPKNLVAVEPSDIVGNQQMTVVRGKVTDAHKYEITGLDMGIKCP